MEKKWLHNIEWAWMDKYESKNFANCINLSTQCISSQKIAGFNQKKLLSHQESSVIE